jgi:hypothetical protein
MNRKIIFKLEFLKWSNNILEHNSFLKNVIKKEKITGNLKMVINCN